jgi:uncharacterized protein YqeY
MNLEQTIEKDHTSARLAKNAPLSLLLGSLRGEIETTKKKLAVGSKFSDEDVLKIIKKMVNNAKENFKLKPSEDFRMEIEYLSKYIPRELTTEELDDILAELSISKPVQPSSYKNVIEAVSQNCQSKNLSFDKKLLIELLKS